ncbi:MAG: glucose-6-phosphate isomerase [Candidatus Cloacimonetes bacterium]|nr:glucose-6-phosphate isomerase [Candidatus Cloacimonadota bacterium]
MNLTIDFTNLFQLMDMPDGITQNDLMDSVSLCDKANKIFSEKKSSEPLGFYDLPDKEVEHILEYVEKIKSKFDTMVVFGIGGSALGNKAVYSALKAQKTLKKLFVYDNVDPYFLDDIMKAINPEKTVFNVITKSGTTAETMASFMFVIDYLKKTFPKDYKDRLITTTDKEKGFLRKLIKDEGFQDFIVPDDVGGRFSVLTDVGLVSSAFVGIDIKAMLKGASDMRKHCDEKDLLKNPAMIIALSHILYKTKNISVMMPYSNPLYDLSDWYRQLWAESLGKRYDLQGDEVFCGQTPVQALGATDQHSQVQLYTEGPKDKIFTLIMVENYTKDFIIPEVYTDRQEVNYLCKKTFSQLLNAECIATEYALTQAGRPNMMIKFSEINEENIGAFIYLYEAATVYAGYMLNINPLDQPGVEAGKIATYALMDKEGFEKQKNEINQYLNKKKESGNILCLN